MPTKTSAPNFRSNAVSYFLFSVFYLLLSAGVARAQTFGAYTDLHDFGETVLNADGFSGLDGEGPTGAGVTFDSAGNMYGTTAFGGANITVEGGDGGGMVWEYTLSGAYKDLHDFGGTVTNADEMSGADGATPEAGVTFDKAGDMYGTAYNGGANGASDGMVWEITASGSYKDLHDFGGTVMNADGESGPDGVNPRSDVTIDGAGNLFGTAYGGGPNTASGGMVWEITASRAYKDLHDFAGTIMNADGETGPDGREPIGGVSFDIAGNLYGTALSGGPNAGTEYASGGGMVWEITASSTYKDLHDFGGTVTNADGMSGPDGHEPVAGIGFDSKGKMYGTAPGGGANDRGMVWEINVGGIYFDLHDFGGTVTNADGLSGPDGAFPQVGVAFDNDGNLYGTAYEDGAAINGMVWSIAPNDKYDDLHDFATDQVRHVDGTTGPDGIQPFAPVTFDNAGNAYGTTKYGGKTGAGIVWEIAAALASPTLTATSGASFVALNWTASAGATVYRVYRGTTSGGEGTAPLKGGIGTTTFTDTAVVTGSTYYYKVTAVNSGGVSEFSNEAHATLAPASPAILTATPGISLVTLNWTASAGATVYRIYRATASGGEGTAALKGGITGTTYADTTAVSGSTYYYKLTAVNTGGASPFSSEAHATPSPAAPANLTATPGISLVTLNWTASAGATVYRVYRGTAPSGETTTPIKGGLTSTSYTDSGVVGGSTYYYKVTAVNTGGASPYSGEAHATLAPAAPANLTATAGISLVTLNWTASAGATVYRVYRSTAASAYPNILHGGLTVTSYTDSSVTNNITYYYQVTAVDSGGASVASNQVGAAPINGEGASVEAAQVAIEYAETMANLEGSPQPIGAAAVIGPNASLLPGIRAIISKPVSSPNGVTWTEIGTTGYYYYIEYLGGTEYQWQYSTNGTSNNAGYIDVTIVSAVGAYPVIGDGTLNVILHGETITGTETITLDADSNWSVTGTQYYSPGGLTVPFTATLTNGQITETMSVTQSGITLNFTDVVGTLISGLTADYSATGGVTGTVTVNPDGSGTVTATTAGDNSGAWTLTWDANQNATLRSPTGQVTTGTLAYLRTLYG